MHSVLLQDAALELHNRTIKLVVVLADLAYRRIEGSVVHIRFVNSLY
jgi:hypothetical protein